MIPAPPVPVERRDPFDFRAEPTPEDRAVWARVKPQIEAGEEAWQAWLVANIQPGERIDQARARYAARPRPESITRDALRPLVRRRPAPRLVWSRKPTPAEVEASDAIDRSAAHLVKD